MPAGDLVFHWPIKNGKKAFYQRAILAGLIGVEADMLTVRYLRDDIVLHVPAEIAGQEAMFSK